MQPIIKENVSVASVGKNIASSRLGHREFESRNVKFSTRISRQNKRFTNMDLAIFLGFKSLRSRVVSLQISHFFPMFISSTVPTILCKLHLVNLSN